MQTGRRTASLKASYDAVARNADLRFSLGGAVAAGGASSSSSSSTDPPPAKSRGNKK